MKSLVAKILDLAVFFGTVSIALLVFLLFRGDATFSEKFSYALISGICSFLMLFFMRWTIVWFWGALKK